MPTYEYRCEKCGKVFEMFQKMTDAPIATHPDETCGGPVTRLFSAGAGFLFKGSGFYITDYRSDSYKQKQKSESGSTGSSSGSSGSDAKTTTKTGASGSTSSSSSSTSTSPSSSSPST